MIQPLCTAGKIVSKVHDLMKLHKSMGVPQDRLIFRVPATWAGIQACRKLEAEGIATQAVLVYSYIQGVAAAQAGVSVVQPNVGRVRDWWVACTRPLDGLPFS